MSTGIQPKKRRVVRSMLSLVRATRVPVCLPEAADRRALVRCGVETLTPGHLRAPIFRSMTRRRPRLLIAIAASMLAGATTPATALAA
ncbi:MAG: hypothetical protein WKF94_19930, partial [Solirubrobacteraceae bacterium]